MRKEIASISWKAPLPVRFVSEEPARKRAGNALTEQLPIYSNYLSVSFNKCSDGIMAHPCQSVKDTWSTHQQANSWFTCEISISTSSIAASLLISKADESNAQIDSFFRNINNGNAHQTEDDSYAEITKGQGDNMCTGR